MSDERHLRLVHGGSGQMAAMPRLPTSASLTASIVHAAHAWAASAMESSHVIDAGTEEGALRLELLDAIHDANYFDANLAARRPGQWDMFGESPGV